MLRAGVVASLVTALGVAALAWLAPWRSAPVPSMAPVAARPASAEDAARQVARGAMVARQGNCMACHTARGGAVGAGGRPIVTPFGTVYSANLTPDEVAGIGRWSVDDLWRALHEGRSRDGRPLVPACPYPSFTHASRDDVEALHAWLRTLPSSPQPSREHDLRFPYRSELALVAWQFLFFEPGGFEPRPDRSPEWNRGAYLVRGLGHCAECHAPRNALGALRDAEALGGARMPAGGWYAPSLAALDEAGVAPQEIDELVALLRDGVTPRASAAGPMAEVVHGSTSHLDAADLRAMAVYLAGLPRPAPRAAAAPGDLPEGQRALGLRVYEQHCVECHGADGRGVAGAIPPLAGNRAVVLHDPVNVLKAILAGGFAPVTAGNPRPHGMPPYAALLTDAEIAAVASHIRSSWGNAAPAVSEIAVLRLR